MNRGFYIFAPMQTATMCGFSVGTLLGGRILSNRTWGYITILPLKRLRAVGGACLMSGASGLILVFANKARVAQWIGQIPGAAIFAVAYELCFICPLTLYLLNVHKKSGVAPLFSWRAFWTLVSIGLAASIPAAVIVRWATHTPTLLDRWVGAEALAGIATGLGVATGFFCVNRLSDSVMAGRKAGNVGEEKASLGMEKHSEPVDGLKSAAATESGMCR